MIKDATFEELIYAVLLKVRLEEKYEIKEAYEAILAISRQLEIGHKTAKHVIDQAYEAVRMAANVLDSRDRETAMDRQIEFAERLLSWAKQDYKGECPSWFPKGYRVNDLSDDEPLTAKLRNKLTPLFNLVEMIDNQDTPSEMLEKEHEVAMSNLPLIREIISQIEDR